MIQRLESKHYLTNEDDGEENYATQYVIPREKLYDGTNHLFRGIEHGGVPLSFFWGHYSRPQGPKLHRHPYDEIHIVEEGRATFTLGNEQIVVEGGHVVITPRNTPHKFVNSGDETLKMISIHCSEKIISEYLE